MLFAQNQATQPHPPKVGCMVWSIASNVQLCRLSSGAPFQLRSHLIMKTKANRRQYVSGDYSKPLAWNTEMVEDNGGWSDLMAATAASHVQSDPWPNFLARVGYYDFFCWRGQGTGVKFGRAASRPAHVLICPAGRRNHPVVEGMFAHKQKYMDIQFSQVNYTWLHLRSSDDKAAIRYNCWGLSDT